MISGHRPIKSYFAFSKKNTRWLAARRIVSVLLYFFLLSSPVLAEEHKEEMKSLKESAFIHVGPKYFGSKSRR